jgi:hypothetical protein
MANAGAAILFACAHAPCSGTEITPRFSAHRLPITSLEEPEHFAAPSKAGPADHWLTGNFQFPPYVGTQVAPAEAFAGFRAEVLAGRLLIYCPATIAKGATVSVVISLDEPGHWPARDWRSHPMTLLHGVWEFVVPVQDIDTAVVYFLKLTDPSGSIRFSPMRVCRPREAGLEQPTRLFWPFLEGFEEGLESWAGLDAQNIRLRIDAPARNGRHALLRSVPDGKNSTAVGTTRIRGAQVLQSKASGLRLWMRTREGAGRARFTLYANAFTPRQVVAPSSYEPTIGAAWQQIDLPFASFPALPLGQIDYFAIEMIGESGMEFLLDDLQLLGVWQFGFE